MPAGRALITLDFETYYDKDYTLKKLSTSEYTRDPRFEVMSMALKFGSKPTKFYWAPDIARILGQIDWPNVEVLAHHTHFDGLVLTHHFGHTPAAWRDTLSMARGLHPKFERNDLASVAIRYGKQNKLEMPDVKGKHLKDLTAAERKAYRAYNIRDVDVTREIYDEMLPQMPADEMKLIDTTVRMFAEPVLRLDVKLAKSELKREIEEREAAIAASGVLALAAKHNVVVKPKKKGDPVTAEHYLGSHKAFPLLLKALNVDPPMKISKDTGKPTYALAKADEDFTDLIAHPNPAVVALVRGRLAAKSTIGETRAARLIRSGSDGKRLPVYLNYCGAHTTRWSGGDKLNYQNLKKKGRIREAIMAPPGHQIVVVDSKTIEVRVLAWLANETWLLDAFRRGLDPYVLFAEDIYGYKITKADVDYVLKRFISKTCVLGLGFQMGGPKLQVSLLAGSIIQGLDPVRLELPVCYSLVDKYRNKNRQIKALWEFMNNEVIAEVATGGKPKEFRGVEYGRGFVQLKGHLALRYPECRADFSTGGPSAWARSGGEVRVVDASYRTPLGRSKLYGGMMTENVVQYLARIVVAEQMLKIAEQYRVVVMSHDEVGFLAPTKDAQKALDFAMQTFRTPPLWAPDLPVDAEGGFAAFYSK